MAKIISKALRVRMHHSVHLKRAVPLEEVARGARVNRNALARLEAGETERFDGPMMARLCVFYGIGLGALLELDPSDDDDERTDSPILARLDYTIEYSA